MKRKLKINLKKAYKLTCKCHEVAIVWAKLTEITRWMERFISAAYKNKHADNNHARTHSQKLILNKTKINKQIKSRTFPKILIDRVKYNYSWTNKKWCIVKHLLLIFVISLFILNLFYVMYTLKRLVTCPVILRLFQFISVGRIAIEQVVCYC